MNMWMKLILLLGAIFGCHAASFPRTPKISDSYLCPSPDNYTVAVVIRPRESMDGFIWSEAHAACNALGGALPLADDFERIPGCIQYILTRSFRHNSRNNRQSARVWVDGCTESLCNAWTMPTASIDRIHPVRVPTIGGEERALFNHVLCLSVAEPPTASPTKKPATVKPAAVKPKVQRCLQPSLPNILFNVASDEANILDPYFNRVGYLHGIVKAGICNNTGGQRKTYRCIVSGQASVWQNLTECTAIPHTCDQTAGPFLINKQGMTGFLGDIVRAQFSPPANPWPILVVCALLPGNTTAAWVKV